MVERQRQTKSHFRLQMHQKNGIYIFELESDDFTALSLVLVFKKRLMFAFLYQNNTKRDSSH